LLVSVGRRSLLHHQRGIEVSREMSASRSAICHVGFGDMEIIEDDNGSVGRAIRARYLGQPPQDDTENDLENALPGAARLVLRLKPKRLSAHGGRMYFGD